MLKVKGELTVVAQQQTCLPVFIHVDGCYEVHLQAKSSHFKERMSSWSKGQTWEMIVKRMSGHTALRKPKRCQQQFVIYLANIWAAVLWLLPLSWWLWLTVQWLTGAEQSPAGKSSDHLGPPQVTASINFAAATEAKRTSPCWRLHDAVGKHPRCSHWSGQTGAYRPHKSCCRSPPSGHPPAPSPPAGRTDRSPEGGGSY